MRLLVVERRRRGGCPVSIVSGVFTTNSRIRGGEEVNRVKHHRLLVVKTPLTMETGHPPRRRRSPLLNSLVPLCRPTREFSSGERRRRGGCPVSIVSGVFTTNSRIRGGD
jgi:hypothetical protein